MSLRRGRVQIVAAKDELENLQQLSNMQPPMTTTPSSSGPSDSSDPSTIDEERLCHQPPHLLDDEWRWLIHFWGMPEAKAQNKEDRTEPNRIEMFALTHTKKDGTPIDDRSKEIMLEKISSSTSTSSIAYTSIDEISTPTSVFGSTSRRQSVGTLATQLENAQELLAAAKQKLINAIGELSHVKETFEEQLIEVQRKTREEMKEEFEGKMMEMQR
ncbi:hypothetical protein AAG906_037883 [Vitis piasezkii]